MTEPRYDPAYFENRAREEESAAASAPDERAREIHLELARRYSAAAAGTGMPPREPEGPAPLLAPEFRIIA